jgi:hypothetical protein
LPPTGSAPDNQKLLQAPKSGRPINTRVPDKLTTGVLKRGKTTRLQAAGTPDGLKARSRYTIRLDGANGPVLAVVDSDDEGNISAGVNIPDSAVPGSHTIDVIGGDQAGNPVDVTQPVFIPENDFNSDGDGLPDTTDSCSAAINSGHDDDRDGIDDTCDPLIDQPPNSGNQIGLTTNTGSGNQPPNSTPSVNRVQPAMTQALTNPLSPVNPVVKAMKLPLRVQATPVLTRPTPYKIRWWLWIILPIVAWLLLVAVYSGTRTLRTIIKHPQFSPGTKMVKFSLQ